MSFATVNRWEGGATTPQRAARTAIAALAAEAGIDATELTIDEVESAVRFESVREELQYGMSVRCTYDIYDHPVLRIPNIEPQRVTANDLKYCTLLHKLMTGRFGWGHWTNRVRRSATLEVV